MPGDHVDLLWIPVGAGGHVVVHTSGWWEWWQARRAHRARRSLFHAALEVSVGDSVHVIEMGPAWGQHDPQRGVVATGPVGVSRLGRLRLFRYEVRCWRGGVIPDRAYAASPVLRFPLGEGAGEDLLTRVARVPRHTWGRDVLGVGDMWNSNSLVAWLLAGSGIDAAALAPPSGGAAPGWAAGIAAAARH